MTKPFPCSKCGQMVFPEMKVEISPKGFLFINQKFATRLPPSAAKILEILLNRKGIPLSIDYIVQEAETTVGALRTRISLIRRILKEYKLPWVIKSEPGMSSFGYVLRDKESWDES